MQTRRDISRTVKKIEVKLPGQQSALFLLLCRYFVCLYCVTELCLLCFMSVSVCMFALSTLRLTKFLLKNFTTTTTLYPRSYKHWHICLSP